MKKSTANPVLELKSDANFYDAIMDLADIVKECGPQGQVTIRITLDESVDTHGLRYFMEAIEFVQTYRSVSVDLEVIDNAGVL